MYGYSPDKKSKRAYKKIDKRSDSMNGQTNRQTSRVWSGLSDEERMDIENMYKEEEEVVDKIVRMHD